MKPANAILFAKVLVDGWKCVKNKIRAGLIQFLKIYSWGFFPTSYYHVHFPATGSSPVAP